MVKLPPNPNPGPPHEKINVPNGRDNKRTSPYNSPPNSNNRRPHSGMSRKRPSRPNLAGSLPPNLPNLRPSTSKGINSSTK
jgi:hypothetical protein